MIEAYAAFKYLHEIIANLKSADGTKIFDRVTGDGKSIECQMLIPGKYTLAQIGNAKLHVPCGKVNIVNSDIQVLGFALDSSVAETIIPLADPNCFEKVINLVIRNKDAYNNGARFGVLLTAVGRVLDKYKDSLDKAGISPTKKENDTTTGV